MTQENVRALLEELVTLPVLAPAPRWEKTIALSDEAIRILANNAQPIPGAAGLTSDQLTQMYFDGRAD